VRSQVCFLALTLIIAISVKDLSVMLALVGATGSTTVSYILPGFFYYLMFKDPADGPAWKRNLALAQGIAGIVIVPLCLTFIFL
jgi:amino acid permease